MNQLRSLFVLCFAMIAMCLVTACLTPLNYSPFSDDKDDALTKQIDRKTVAELLKTKDFISENKDMKLSFHPFSSGESEATHLPDRLTDDSDVNADELILRASFTHYVDDKNDKKVETHLPILMVPFRFDNDKLFATVLLDTPTIVKDAKLSPFYAFMQHPYYYILRMEKKDGGSFSAQFVQFANFSLSGVTKNNDDVSLDEEGIVMNATKGIQDMLKDEKNYKLAGDDFIFLPVK